MEPTPRELLLHKLLAGSAFAFALCILPLTQYVLVASRVPEKGTVAGVSTDSEASTFASAAYASSQECEQAKQEELDGLATYANGKKAAILETYAKAVRPYREALNVVTATNPEDVAAEKAALQELIDQEYQPYLEKLSAVESAVASQKLDIESRACAAE